MLPLWVLFVYFPLLQVDELENAVLRQSQDTSSVLTTPESKKQPASSKPITPGQQVKIDMVRFWKLPYVCKTIIYFYQSSRHSLSLELKLTVCNNNN